MGLFPWTAGHAKQGSDKSQYLPHEWFNKSTAEPSRQALDQLRREFEDGGEMSPTASPRSRSRSATLSSAFSYNAKSSSDKSSGGLTRPPSRQSVIQDPVRDVSRSDSAARGFFSKGSRMIKQQGRKLTLGPSQSEKGLHAHGPLDPDVPSLSKRGSSSKSSGRRSNPASSPKAPVIKPTISGPYDFQHLAHSHQGHFQSLNKASRLDLAHEFTAVQQCQTPADEIQGIAVGDLPPSAGSGVSAPTSPTSPTMPDLPSTPPRPPPPPKDGLSPTPETPNVRLSRSMENFSRPTKSPVAARFGMSPVPEHASFFTDGSPPAVPVTVPQSPGWAEETFTKLAGVTASRPQSADAAQVLLAKPLPQPPIVHAVSTTDDSALPLPNALLPDVPQAQTVAAEGVDPDETFGQRVQSPGRMSLRHAQSFPTTKLFRCRTESSGDVHIAWSFPAQTSTTPPVDKARRISIGIKKIDIEDWEDAIDYAWDHPLETEDIGVPAFDEYATTQTPPSRPESFLVVRQPPPEPHSQPTTPLMMTQAPNKPLPTPDPTKRFSSLPRPTKKRSLRGLGIASSGPQTQLTEHNASPDGIAKRESYGVPLGVPSIPAIRREPGSPMSKSSSQESIILSIASSIMGTHRSSNSSTSLGDLSNLASIEDENECDSSQDPARPITDDATTPPGSTITRASNDSNRSGNTSDGSQETVKTDIMPIAPNHAPPPPPNEQSPLSPVRQARATSISRANVPNRTSSIAAPTMSKGPAARSRSSTLSSRPRYNPSRGSYSLFPSPQSSIPATNAPTP